MRALQGADGNRRSADIEAGDRARPAALAAPGGGTRISRRGSPPQMELPFAADAPDFVADVPAPEDSGA
jgi:hypothetical protein